MEDLSILLNSKRISKVEYDYYVMFHLNEEGRKFFSRTFETYLLEEPESYCHESSFAFTNGRQSVWREIKNSISKIEFLLTEMKRGNHE